MSVGLIQYKRTLNYSFSRISASRLIMSDMNLLRSQLAPTGVLRAGINLSNFLLVTGRDEETGAPRGVSPTIATYIANKLDGERFQMNISHDYAS